MYEDSRLVIGAVGLGKCVCGQTASEELIRDGFLERVLVVAPLRVANATWGHEHEKWDHLGEVGIATGTPEERRAVIDSDVEIVVINIENLVWFFNMYGHNHNFDGLLIDEISKFKTAGGRTFKKLRAHLKDFSWRCGMSATPIAESGMDIYAQVLIIDGGKALGRNQETFRRTYFMQVDHMGYDWEIQPGGAERLAEDISDVVYIADDSAHADGLPDLIDVRIPVDIPDVARTFYAEMAKEGIVELPDGGLIEAPNAAVVQGKLQCVASGAVYDDDGETRWLHRAKFDALDTVLADAEGPVMLAYQYIFEREELRARYPGAVFLAETPDCIAAWNRGEVELLVLSPKSAAHGLNLQAGGHELICMGPVWSSDQWSQLLGRIRRRGQASEYVRRTTLVGAGTVDEIVLDRLAGKSQDEGVLLDHLRDVCS